MPQNFEQTLNPNPNPQTQWKHKSILPKHPFPAFQTSKISARVKEINIKKERERERERE